jgi:predicted phage terminase large subunit-like protein
VLSLDTAFKVGSSNDYSVGLVLGVGEAGYYLLDVWRDRAEFPELKRKVEMLATRWTPHVVLIEDKASGQSLIQELRSDSRLPIRAIKVDSDKVTRAAAITPLVEAGRVFLPEAAPWLPDFMDEVSSFPAAPHDDMVDALTQALNYVRESSPGGIFDFYKELAERQAAGLPEPEPDNDIMRVYTREMERLAGLEGERRGVIHIATVSSGPGASPLLNPFRRW